GQLAGRRIALGLELGTLGVDAPVLDGVEAGTSGGDIGLRLVDSRLELHLLGRASAALQQVQLALGRLDRGVGGLNGGVGGSLGYSAGSAVVIDRDARSDRRIGTWLRDALLQSRLLGFGRSLLGHGCLDGRL